MFASAGRAGLIYIAELYSMQLQSAKAAFRQPGRPLPIFSFAGGTWVPLDPQKTFKNLQFSRVWALGPPHGPPELSKGPTDHPNPPQRIL